MIRLSASAVPRGLACTASLVLPHQDYRTMYAEDGQDRHDALEKAAVSGDIDSLPPEVRALVKIGDLIAAECAFAYDCATDVARELGHVSREYGTLAPFEIPGTCDLLIQGNGRLVVVDYKSFEEVDHAEVNEQLATYALMAARTYGLTTVTVAIVYLSGLRRATFAELGPLDLDGHAARLRQLHVDAAKASANPAAFVSPGRHCKYCPAFLSCPAQRAELVEVSSGDGAMRIEALIPLDTDEAAADAFDLLGRIKMLATRIQAALYARAAERPIPLTDGRVLGPVTKQGNEKLDGDVVYRVIKEQHGQMVADAAVIRSATKKQIKAALAGCESVAAAERDVLRVVREQGGATREARTVIEIHDRKQIANG